MPDSSPIASPHLHWQDHGVATLTGPLADLKQALDGLFLAWAARVGAERIDFPRLILAQHLEKIDYFKSFPHMATFAVTLDAETENIKAFAKAAHDAGQGLELTRTAPVRQLLTPAPCYHVYPHLAGRDLKGPVLITTLNHCARREEYYEPLRRQWGFAMREIVCVGSKEEVQAFLRDQRAYLEAWVQALGLPVQWKSATDAFFDPRNNPKYVAAKLDPVKTEMVFGDLAIGSLNFHKNFFAEAFKITRDGQTAYSGCIGWGLERWVYAILKQYGEEPGAWPVLQA